MAKSRIQPIFCSLVKNSVDIKIKPDVIIVQLGRWRSNSILIVAGYGGMTTPCPWLQDQTMKISFC